MEQRKRRHFTPEFKADTVKLVLREGKSMLKNHRVRGGHFFRCVHNDPHAG